MKEEELRFELVKICSVIQYPTNNIIELIEDVKKLTNFIKNGSVPQTEGSH